MHAETSCMHAFAPPSRSAAAPPRSCLPTGPAQLDGMRRVSAASAKAPCRRERTEVRMNKIGRA
eukprot:6190402-Pleurochrysis_carterae.AAC.3